MAHSPYYEFLVPELPEVETVVRSLRPHIVGRCIVKVQAGPKHLRNPWRKNWAACLENQTVAAVHRRGKWILLELTGCEELLVIHLGMTGRLSIEAADAPRTKHTHLVFTLDRAQELRFDDPRRFGSITITPSGLTGFIEETRLGPEPFDAPLDAFHAALRRSRRCLKAILLDQSVLAGLGNIYADETLFEARLHPRRLGTTMKREESHRLRRAAAKVLRRAIAAKGSTIANFYFGDGESGGYQTRFRVYGRTGEPCRRCQRPITQIRLAGRSTHFCAHCQPFRRK